jgi:ABC-type transport system substrate-binding protein
MHSSYLEDAAKGITIGALVFIFVFSALPVQSVHAATSNGRPYFTITLEAPSTNPVRRQWAAIIQNSFSNAGIQANLVYVASFTILSETIFGADSAGKLYSQGGYDAFFVGAGGGTALPDFGTESVNYYRNAYPSDFPPAGNDWFWWRNSTYNALALKYNNDFNGTDRLSIAKQMIQILAQERPGMTILYPSSIYAYSPALNGWNTGGSAHSLTATTAERDFDHWSGVTAVNLAETGQVDNVNILPNTVQNTLYSQNLAGNLGEPTQEPDGRGVATYSCSAPDPCTGIAKSITTSADHITWTENLRAANWQDSAQVTADDYLFGEQVIDSAAYGYVGLGSQQSLLGLGMSFTYLNGTASYLSNGTFVGHTLPAGLNITSAWKSINATAFSFTMPSAYIFTNPLITSVTPLPKHLYEQLGSPTNYAVSTLTGFTDSGNLGMSTVKYTWNPSAGGDGSGTAAGGAYGGNGSVISHGVITDGAYIYDGYNTVSQTATAVAWPGYWNATGLQSIHEFGIQTLHLIVVIEKTAAIAGMGAGTYNVLDSQYTFSKDDAASITAAGGLADYVSDPSNGFQDMVLNDNSPIWGTGTATPLGQSNPAMAHTAALDIRHAMSVLIPRQQIVDQLLQGLGTPGITEDYWLPTQPASIYSQIYQGVSPDPYDPALAQQLLAAAGYNTGSTSSIVLPAPPTLSPTCTINATAPISVPQFTLGNSLTFSGTFAVIPGTFAGDGGAAVTLQQSTDGGTTWTPVTFAETNEGAYYSFSYQPTLTGTVEYRVFFTGVAWPDIQSRSISSAGRVESLVPPQTATNGLANVNITDTQYSDAQTYKIGTLADVASSIVTAENQATNNALCNLDKSLSSGTSSAISTLNTNIQTALNTLNAGLANSAKASDITTLNNNVSTATDVAYAALAVAIVLGLIAIFLSRRKPS